MEAYRPVIMEAFMDRFTAAELLSYKEVLYDEAPEEWYAPYDPDEVEREERNCVRLVRQFYHLVEEYRERFFTYVLFQSPPRGREITCRTEHDVKVELVYLKQCNVIWLNRENLALAAAEWLHVVARMQLKCRVRRRFVDESGIRERYERYIAKAVMELLTTLRFHSMRYTRFVHFQNLARIQSYLTFCTH